MAFRYSPKIVTDGLVFYLDAANPNSFVNGSSVWNDLGKNGYTGTLINGPTYNSLNGGSIVFDGTDDGVSVTVPTIGDTTYAVWFKMSANNSNKRLINASTSNFRNFSIGYDGSGANNVLGGYDGTNQPLTVATFADGLWHYAVVVMKTNDYKIYVDGQNQTLTWGLGSTGNWVNNTTNVNYIGSSNVGQVYNGNMASVQIYNRALSATEVLQNYNTMKSRFGR